MARRNQRIVLFNELFCSTIFFFNGSFVKVNKAQSKHTVLQSL